MATSRGRSISSNGTTRSKFDYRYDAVGNIATWQQQSDADPATIWDYVYDAADQLITTNHKTTAVTPVVLKRYAYAYDAAGNRVSEQIDDTATESVFDVRNRLTQVRGGGLMRFAGLVSEPATVIIQGVPAVVSAANALSGTAPVAVGTTTVSVVASRIMASPTSMAATILATSPS